MRHLNERRYSPETLVSAGIHAISPSPLWPQTAEKAEWGDIKRSRPVENR
jgi:hypothetical protein